MAPRRGRTRGTAASRALGVAIVLAIVLVLGPHAARADEPAATVSLAAPPPIHEKVLSPDARRFYAPGALSSWAGTERVIGGELSVAAPRPPEGEGFLPALDDHLSTTSYLQASHAFVRRYADANVVELSSLHDFQGGTVANVLFRGDARVGTGLQGGLSASIPLGSTWFVPTFLLGSGSDDAANLLGGVELRGDRSKSLGYSLGVEASRWSYDRSRILGTIGMVLRVTGTTALEQRLSLGAWSGGALDGDVAARWMLAALQTYSWVTLYERVTLARGATPALSGADTSIPPDASAWSIDLSLAARRMLSEQYGLVLQADEGGQQGTYRRFGLELAVYGALF